MTTFHIEQFGCRATQADAAAIERQLLERGFAPSARAAAADVVVINTCTVTANADSQARQAIRHFHAENPRAHIIVTGCYAQRAPEELAQIDGVSWVVGNSHKTEIARLVECGSSLSPSSAGACSGPDPHFGFLPIGALAGDEPLSLDCGPAKILTGNIFEQSDILVAPVFGGEGDHTRSIEPACAARNSAFFRSPSARSSRLRCLITCGERSPEKCTAAVPGRFEKEKTCR
jgi:threonylcarbamoyladenosine tRNA methylthiotransferase MtaB